MERFANRNRGGIRTAGLLIGAAWLAMAGCSPKLAPVTTSGLLTRSFDNYSQSTVVRSERLMTETRNEAPIPSRIPRQEYTRGARSGEGTLARSQAEVIAPKSYATPTMPSAKPSVPVPKQTKSRARQQARLEAQQRAQERAAAEERSNEPVKPVKTGFLGIPKATEASAARMKNISFVTRKEASPNPSQPPREPERTITPPEPENPAPTAARTAAPAPPAAQQEPEQSPVQTRPPREQQVSGATTLVSEVKPAMTAKEQRELDKRRKAEARRLLAERQAQIRAAEAARVEQQRAALAASAPRKSKPAEPEETELDEEEETATQEAAAPESAQQTLQSAPPQTEEEESAAESSDPDISALAKALAVPDATVHDKPIPAFINTPQKETADSTATPETTTSETQPAHQFQPNETEHVKFSYYDPFGKENNRFVVVLNEQRFCYPYPGKFLSGYGPRGRGVHTGVDIKGEKNDTVRAAFAGTVRLSKPYSGYGNCVVIRHKNGLETLYAHNTRNLVQVGDAVRAGDPIGLIGRTGRATTEHCHFEVRIQGQHINPALVIDYQNHKLKDGVLSVTKQANGRIVAQNRASGLAPSQATDREDISSSEDASAGSGSKAASTATPTYYTVRSGDTLWGIARRFGTTITKLCALNNLNREATLPLGKRLKIR